MSIRSNRCGADVVHMRYVHISQCCSLFRSCSFNSCTRPRGQPDAFYSLSNRKKELRQKDGTECLLLLALARGLGLLDHIVTVVLCQCSARGQRCVYTDRCWSSSSRCFLCCLSFSLRARNLVLRQPCTLSTNCFFSKRGVLKRALAMQVYPYLAFSSWRT